MNYDNLNEIINYIEKNLENDIDLKDLSKIIGLNDFIFQRVFMFLTGITINDYIKKRRLSRAYEEIKNTDKKIIDIATKYHYNSVSSFNRAFKKLFDVTPTEARKSKNNYKVLPIFNFDKQTQVQCMLDYKIEYVDELTLYCKHVISDDLSNILYKIRKLYAFIKKSGEHEFFGKYGMYGFYTETNGLCHYYVGSQKFLGNLEKYVIKSGKYAVFRLNSREQKDILALEKKLYKEWINSTDYEFSDGVNFELYEGDHCYIYVSIK